MSQFIATYANTLLLVKQVNGRFHIEKKLEGMNPTAIAQDPFNPDILYCGTFDRGLWKSVDKGDSWLPIGTRFTYNSPFKKQDIPMTSITAVSVIDTGNNTGAVLVGTEPSALFISYDQGDSFELLTDFAHIPGKEQWFFTSKTAHTSR
ncbi:WD40/YVTN/BNR-like repeat-containing protein [Staphylococcus saprophyticus]